MPTLAVAGKDHEAQSSNRADALARELSAAIEQLLRDGNPDGLSDDALRECFASVVKLFTVKAENADFSSDFVPYDPNVVTATQTVVTACSMIRASDLNMFDVGMWFARRDAARD